MLSNYVHDNHTNKRPIAFVCDYAVGMIRVVYRIYVRVSMTKNMYVGVMKRS